ncbi:MAG: InlB B-repeat-containing protein [Coriobacteriales bacterium]|nr:InlB B-repeat-containing protein [Coriobacteriales bacterium]
MYSNDTWISASNEGTNGTIIWSAATHASTGVIESLPAGSYRVKEIGVDPTDSWYVETATGADWVYFDILPSGGAVYLSNLSRLGGAGTEKTPLQSSKNSAEKWFYNTSTQGTLGVWKLNGSGSTTNITGATFELYPTADGTAPSGSKVATLTSNATTYYTYDSGVTTRAESNSGNYYKATVRAGDYLLKEVIAPNGYALRTSFVPVTVVGGQSGIAAGNFNGYANSANINSVGFLDPPATTLSVKKLADYPAIMLGGQEIVAAHTEVIPGLPFTLYKYTGPVDGAAGHNNQADFTKQAEQTTWPGATSGSNERGVAKFSITEEGEYRIVEESLGAGHEFLGYNPDFQSKDGKLGNAPSIFASYDATTNKLVVTTQDSTTNAGSTWNAVNNELAVKNPFVGFQVAARKIDYLSDNPLAGATFSLYATEADAKANTNKVSLGGRTQTFTTDASGIVLFDPFFLNVNENSRSYWIREDSVPTDYAIDEWYDARIKQVTVARGGSATASASFSNGLKGPDPSDLNLALEKTTGTLNPADKTLVQSAVDTTYTLKTPGGSLGNQLPLYNFTISDTGIIFKGGNPLTKIVDSAIQPGNLPSYHIKEVRVGPSYSYASAADKKHGADKLSAVWANVNNLGWKRLDQTQAWTLANPGDQSFSVIYSTMDPSNTQVTDVYGKTVGDPASGYWVGSEFTAGNISYDVTFNTFTPKSDQPEVSQAVNTANVALDKARGDKTRVSRSDDATIDWTIAERPKMLVQTTLDAAYGHDANGEIDTNRPKNIGGQPAPEAGDYFDYTLMLKNASPNALDLSYPILIDYLEPDAMTLDSYEVTLPDGTTSTDLGAQFENKSAYLVWQFPSVVLAQNDTVSIKVRFKLNSIVPHSEVTNEVYGTSGMPLSYSDRYATGASFEAVDMTSSNAIYVDGGGNANSRYGRGQVAAQSAAVYYNKLTSAGVPVKAQGYDLFVRAAVSGTAILPANDVILQKAVAVNDGTYATNDTAALLNVQFGDTVSYRLRVKTPASADTKGLKLYDLLPCSGDVRGTAWSTSLLNQLRPTGTYAVFRGDTDITAQVSVASTTIALADTKEAVRQASYDKAGIVADATAVCFDFGSAAIGGNSVVEAVFELKVCEPGSSASANDTSAPTSQDPAADHAALLSANALKTAGNTFDADLPLYQGASFLTTFMLKGTDPVNIRLMPEPAHIAGFVWEDRNLNGRWADAPAGTAATIVSEQTSSPDVAKPGVTVRLHKYVNNTEVFPVFAPAQGYWALTITSDGTATKADGSLIATGSYVFENLESSYGTGGASEVRYSVEVVNPSSADTTYYFTTKGAGTNSTLDSDVYGRESDGSQHANSGWSDSFVVNTAAAVDAGLYQKSRISGLVWEDINDNGVQDTSEPGIGSVVVKLQKSSDNGVSWSDYTMTTTSVAGSGAYSFDALELPYGDTSLYRAVFDKGAVTNKAYTYKWASVYDGNNDKAKFDVLPCTDDLTVASADRKVRYALAGPNISLGYATTVQDYDAGITPEGKYIAGYIWEDTNDDGLSNDTSYDLPMRNLTVRLYVDDFDRAEYDNYAQPIATTVSDAFGCYRFFDATDGGLSHALTLDALGRPLAIDFSKTYQVEFELPSGSQWAFVSAKVGSDDTIDSDVTPPGVDNTTTTRAVSQLIGGSAATTFAIVDCGMMQTSTISGKIWFDTDDNGSQVGENFSTKPAPVTVELYQQGQGDVWAKVATTTTTSADARFSFGGLRSGNYKLGFDRSGLVSDTLSYKWALPHAAAAGFDSDALYASRVDDTAETALISLSYYTSLIDQDAGITPYAHITGFAWLDDDRNGARNAGETPFANVRVHLLDSTSSQPVATTLTDATGSYMFDDLLPSASFKVAFINPSAVDYSFTTAGVHHKATNLIASPLGSTYENYFSAGHTHFINLATHSNSELNSGFYLIPNHTVTYVPNGGSASWGSGDFSITIKEGRLVPNQAVSSATATFLGWFVGPDNTSLWDFVAQRMPAHDVVLTAQWEQEPVAPPVVTTYYHLIYDANGGSGNVPMDATDYTPGDAVALADGTGLSCEGCSFQGWALTVQGPPITNFNITADTTVYAQWLPLAVDEATSLVTSAPSTSTRTFFDDFIASLFGTDIPTINLGGVEIPLAAAPGEAAWALLNLVMLILGALLSLLSFGLYFRKRTSEVQSDKNGKERTQEGSGDSGDLKRKRLTWRILSLALAVIALILFLLVEDLTLKMVLIDLWTPLFMVILILQIVFTVVGKRRKTVKAGEDKDGRLAPPMYGKTPTAV